MMEINTYTISKQIRKIYNHLFFNEVSIYPLVTFRIVFGLLMLVSLIRFWANGWIEELYIQPDFFFHYFGFSWLPVFESTGIYIVFSLIVLSSLSIALGSFYRVATVIFFLGFTYLELIDVTNYLNHYYFVSLIAFLLIWLPANRFFSIDTYVFPHIRRTKTSAWSINIIKFQLGVVYLFAGIAKLNADWLFGALPLKIWLPAKSNIPIFGALLDYEWVAYAFSWGGALFDLSVFFLLIYSKTRLPAYVSVILFHIITWLLFPIGMFPFIMIGSTLIFFSSDVHKHILQTIRRKKMPVIPTNNVQSSFWHIRAKWITFSIAIYIFFQLTFPFRYLLYPGNLFWTEQGYRFSWRVMLMEKAGYATFHVEDTRTGNKAVINNADYLTAQQERMMATQPDMICQYAHFLSGEYKMKGFENPKVYVESYVSLNGQGSQLFIDPEVDIAGIKDSFKPKDWILSYSK